METKDKLLALLQSRKGEFVSGEEIAQSLNLSRTAVWKAANALRDSGYAIDAVRNRGYRLDVGADILGKSQIEALLGADGDGLTLEVLSCVDSTNSLLREKANAGIPEGYVILAGQQTGGRGRMGRRFYSPPDTGLYLSLLLRPTHLPPARAVGITTMAAVAACRAIEAVSKQASQIKWVNDIYLGGKKVCGILTEASFGLEDGFLEYAVLGIGVNVFPPREGFPDELRELAGSVFTQPCSDGKNRLTAAILNRLMAYYTAPEKARYVQAYRARSLVIGKDIQVLSPEGTKSAHALDVDEDCHLIVRYDDGRIENLSYGEISIRPADSGAQRF